MAQATEQAVIASNAASEASNSASGASTSASAAAASASSASDSASASASSATAAQASADEALSSKNSAKSEADRAKSEADRAAEIVGGDFVKSSEKGAANGVATLGADGKVPESQLPEISKAGIPITSAPDDDTTIWIDPDEDDQTESFYTKAETNELLQNKADLGADGKVPTTQLPEISSVKTFTATIGTTWTENEDTGVKSQSVPITGVLAKHTAKVDHAYTGDGTSDGYATFVEAENQYLTYITNGYAETYDGGIAFHIFGDAPTVSIPIVVEVA